MFSDVGDGGACNGRDNDNATGILVRSRSRENRRKDASQIEHPADIQIEDLLTAPVRRGLKRPSPSSTGIRHKYVQLGFVLRNGITQLFDFFGVGNVRRNADGTPLDSGEFVEALDGLINALGASGFAGGDEDCFGASQQECGCGVQAEATRA